MKRSRAGTAMTSTPVAGVVDTAGGTEAETRLMAGSSYQVEARLDGYPRLSEAGSLHKTQTSQIH